MLKSALTWDRRNHKHTAFKIVRSVVCMQQVFQVQKKDTGQIYAMKIMRKEKILAKDHGEYVRAERNVLTAVFHPYIVTLRCSFQVQLTLHAALTGQMSVLHM